MHPLRTPRGRALLVFISTAALAYAVLVLMRSDRLPISQRMWALQAFYPAYIVRGLLSGSEMGFGDARDTGILVVVTAGMCTAITSIADAAARRLAARGAS